MNRRDALNSPPLFVLPSGETVFVWIVKEPVAVFAQVGSGDAYVTAFLTDGEDGPEFGRGTSKTLVAGHPPGELEKLHAIARSTVNLFNDAGEDAGSGRHYLNFDHLVNRLLIIRSAGVPPSLGK